MSTTNAIASEKIWAGEPLGCNLAWHDYVGVAEIPASVAYRVFDAVTEAALTASIAVADPDDVMFFVIPAASLPIGAYTPSRRVLVVITATFEDATVVNVVGVVTINKLPVAA